MPPLSLLKLVIGGPLYFMFLAPSLSDHAGSDADSMYAILDHQRQFLKREIVKICMKYNTKQFKRTQF